MKVLNDYLFNVLKTIQMCQNKGLLKKPLKYKMNRNDKKVINNIYNIYTMYKYGINKKEFKEMCINYSVNSGINIIKSANDICILIEKIKK